MIELPLTPGQVERLRPVFGLRGTHCLVASVHPTGTGWAFSVHPIPAERRSAIQAACAGTLQLSKRKSKPAVPTA